MPLHPLPSGDASSRTAAPGGYVYHALNRASRGCRSFKRTAITRPSSAFSPWPWTSTRRGCWPIAAYHWHFVLWPATQGEMTAFLRWLTHTHTQRWHAHHGTAGTGHLYQGRFKSFPIEADDHLYTVLRYAERNALRANLVARAERWRWSSLAHRLSSAGDPIRALLHPWPVPMPRDWLERVQRPETEAELEAVRRAV